MVGGFYGRGVRSFPIWTRRVACGFKLGQALHRFHTVYNRDLETCPYFDDSSPIAKACKHLICGQVNIASLEVLLRPEQRLWEADGMEGAL